MGAIREKIRIRAIREKIRIRAIKGKVRAIRGDQSQDWPLPPPLFVPDSFYQLVAFASHYTLLSLQMYF